MTPVREDVVLKVVGKSCVEPKALSDGDAYEIITQAVGELTLDYLQGLQPIQTILKRVCGGLEVTIKTDVLSNALPKGVRADTPFLFCAAISDRLSWGGEQNARSSGSYLVLNRKQQFFRLDVSWRECTVVRDGRPPTERAYQGWFEAEKLFLESADLPALLAEGEQRARLVFGIIDEFYQAQKETSQSLQGRQAHSMQASCVLDGYLRRLGSAPTRYDSN